MGSPDGPEQPAYANHTISLSAIFTFVCVGLLIAG